MKRTMILLSMAALLLAGTVSAAVKQGDMEVDALAGYTQVSAEGGGDVDALFLTGRVGYFVTNNVQVAGVGMGAWIDAGGTDVSLYAIGASGKFCFTPDKQWVPYVGGQILWGTADLGGATTDGMIYGPLGGVRFECTPTTDLFIEGQYNFFGGDLGDSLDNMILVMVGFVHQWK